ncbi:30S ribosomal protein S17 [Candidatus Roizmanbacteria bacterium CG_4_9_14_0_2_um_filter_39_13]|uniref:Small ribosomal subunit protein uS17 n=2 Tax=Candidatus Roizmaniibacteriota TaxID=1752723 RepID=A0A2M8EXI3_9BACT|nr:MAG: 30S ribosomal protein S17 [Candidatus Roizmanbacteria bacterium CG_4_10_14_0_2_um_filter_39_12]PJC30754.1 MAG: 30S ribosomal protein S17 [Candidatus Roizmanbacteria bacterium CG_4_9_14_0_2_um_filter_39_13]PJE62273.1 MAG: 30S ribosomal protein S17 [Candidatus Roizmanbacteria bacterium CG10_big_fil_rev_8_21_14_0_10_39_12]
MNKQITGVVVSTAMMKTIVVRTERKYRHPLYLKVITKHTKFKARNDLEGIVVGDTVTIEETRPISKDTHFRVISKAKPSKK